MVKILTPDPRRSIMDVIKGGEGKTKPNRKGSIKVPWKRVALIWIGGMVISIILTVIVLFLIYGPS
jgi:hypothetical protein